MGVCVCVCVYQDLTNQKFVNDMFIRSCFLILKIIYPLCNK